MDIIGTRNDEIFLFDPKVFGYDTSIWKTISGVPAIVGNDLSLNAAEINSFAVFRNGSIEFALTIPVAPTAGHARAWGLKVANLGNNGRIEFDITGTVFSAKIYDESGTLLGSYPINWNAAWTAAQVKYRLFYWERNCYFAINNTIVAKFEEVAMSKLPLSLHVNNSVADAMLLSALSVY